MTLLSIARSLASSATLMLLTASALGCGSTAPDARSPVQVVRDATPPDKIIDTETGEEITIADLISLLVRNKVIYLGEVHDDPLHHQMQMQIIRGLFVQDPSLAIGLEMVQQPFQSVLDQWTDGQLDEQNLRRGIEWDTRWGFDFANYRAIFEFARSRSVTMIALNARQEITRAVGLGGLDSLSEEQRAHVPELDLTNEQHRELVRAALESHHGGADSFERMYTAQVIWDETMAAGIGAVLSGPQPPSRVVVLAGRMHVERGLGIPARATRWGGEPYQTVVVVDEEELEAILDEDEPVPAPARFLWLPED